MNAPGDGRLCRIDGCGVLLPVTHYFCPTHWSHVPRVVRNDILNAQLEHGVGSHEHRFALHLATLTIAVSEGRLTGDEAKARAQAYAAQLAEEKLT